MTTFKTECIHKLSWVARANRCCHSRARALTTSLLQDLAQQVVMHCKNNDVWATAQNLCCCDRGRTAGLQVCNWRALPHESCDVDWDLRPRLPRFFSQACDAPEFQTASKCVATMLSHASVGFKKRNSRRLSTLSCFKTRAPMARSASKSVTFSEV